MLSSRCDKTQVPSFQTCQSQSKRDLIIIGAVYGLISESEEWNCSAGSTLKCFNCADKKKKKKKLGEKKECKVKIKITESLPTPAGRLLSRLCMSSQMNGQLLEQICRREGKRKSISLFFFYTIKGKQC